MKFQMDFIYGVFKDFLKFFGFFKNERDKKPNIKVKISETSNDFAADYATLFFANLSVNNVSLECVKRSEGFGNFKGIVQLSPTRTEKYDKNLEKTLRTDFYEVPVFILNNQEKVNLTIKDLTTGKKYKLVLKKVGKNWTIKQFK